jgi:2-polyprenyl-3-methyl-5-hydroxy-6-metoxy-1,4-benzoquinol methylase
VSNPYFIKRDKCPACSSTKFRTTYQHPFNDPPLKNYLENFYSPQGKIEFEYLEDATYVLAECEICELIFQQEIPNDNLMKRLYEQWRDPQKIFSQLLKRNDLGYYSFYAQEIMQIIAYLNKVPSSLNFFDYGMGWCKWALMAKAFGCNAYGLELSNEIIEYAKSNGINVITWDEIPQHQFDFINTEQIFEHLSDPSHALLQLKKALKYDGILKISVPTANDMERRLKIMDWKAAKGTRNSLNPVAPLEHINFFRRKSLIKMATTAGMREVFIPLRLQYQFTTNWRGIRRTAKNILFPVYRNIMKRHNYLLFRNEK